MNYIGSKYSLLPDITRVLDTFEVPKSGTALDLFAGTGMVAQLLKKRGHITYANDWQYYSHLTCVASIEYNTLPDFTTLLSDSCWKKLIELSPILALPVCSIDKRSPVTVGSTAIQVLSYLNQLQGTKGRFYEEYCEGGKCGRLYFSQENGLKIQAIRDKIELWRQDQLISSRERAWLIASLLEGADRVANTASVYGAYLKHIKRSAQKPLKLCLIVPVPSSHGAEMHRAYCSDSEVLLNELRETRLGLVYIDPPYNSRQYNANYHILETIAKWDLDEFEPRGVTGLRSFKENCSAYCSKTRVLDGFHRLLSSINAEHVLFSYSNEGLVKRPELEILFNDNCSNVHFDEIPYKRFRADLDGENRVYKGDETVEYLILGKLKSGSKVKQHALASDPAPIIPAMS